MRYAAKRTWPERPKSWEYQDEAESIDAFALAFAAARELAVDDEFAVIEREGDAEIQFFRVSGRDPYVLAPVTSQQSAAPTVPPTTASAAASSPRPLPDLHPFISTVKYMAKVGAIAVLAIALMAVLIGKLKAALG